MALHGIIHFHGPDIALMRDTEQRAQVEIPSDADPPTPSPPQIPQEVEADDEPDEEGDKPPDDGTPPS